MYLVTVLFKSSAQVGIALNDTRMVCDRCDQRDMAYSRHNNHQMYTDLHQWEAVEVNVPLLDRHLVV
jgi:hypothetical protein